MDSASSRLHPSRRSMVTSWMLVVAGVALSISGADAVVCSQSQQGELATLVAANKAVFQSCVSDLKLYVASTASSDALASFITEDYLQDKNADLICASNNCVRALIQAMENLPDCCAQVNAATRNLPRLADDILHQCDVRDARQLAAELEAEIAKLPDLKVQIKSLGTGKGGYVSSGADSSATVGDGVNVIIDVKKRELMKMGVLGLTPSNGDPNNSTVVASSTSAAGLAASAVSLLVVALCSAVQLVLLY